MLLKLSLGLAILLGLATLFVSHVQVGGKINTLNETLASTESELQASRADNSQLRTDIKAVRADLDDTIQALGDATNRLAQAVATAQEQQTRADRASQQLTEVTAERNEAQQELSQWRLFEMTPDQIRNSLARLRQVELERNVFSTENEALTRRVTDLRRQLARYEGTLEPEPELPPGVKGNVVAVDPKYDFVVIDIGGNQGLVEDGRLLVNRDGKLIGQLRITSVQPNRSVANIIPEWEQDDIMEGDQVIAKGRL